MGKVITHSRIKDREGEKHREHNHFPQGKTGYDPKLARLMRK